MAVLFFMSIILNLSGMKVYAAGPIENKEFLENSLYVGDSFTVRLESELVEQGISFMAAAEPGSTTENMLDYDYPDIEPSRIILLAGINNFMFNNSPDNNSEINDMGIVDIDSEIKLIEYLKEKYQCQIFVQAVFPVSDIFMQSHQLITNKEIESYNLMLKYYCMNSENVYYIDTRNGFLDDNNFLERYDDGLHLSWDDYGLWLSNIADAIAQVEGD